MLRLVWKDVAAAGWFLLVGLPLYVVQAVGMAAAAPALLVVTLVFTVALAFGSIGIEELQDTEVSWLSLPVSRRDLVLARYASTALGTLLGLGTSWVAARVAWAWILTGSRVPSAPPGAGAYAVLFAFFLVAAALFLPCYFRLGMGRGLLLFSALSFALLVLVSLAGWAAVRLAGGPEAIEALRIQDPERLAAARAWLDRWGAALAAGAAATAAALFAGSAALSTTFYRNRDC